MQRSSNQGVGSAFGLAAPGPWAPPPETPMWIAVRQRSTRFISWSCPDYAETPHSRGNSS